MSKVIGVVKPHVRSIAFPKRVKWTPKIPEWPTTVTASAKQIKSESFHRPDTIEVFRVIPQRFRRRQIDVSEVEYIQRGGPE